MRGMDVHSGGRTGPVAGVALRRAWTTVLWDWDGTIADTVPLIIAAHHAATEEILGRRLDETLIRARIGEPARRRIGALVGPAHAHDVFQRYSRHLQSVGDDATQVFPEIEGLLADAAGAGLVNVIVTSRPRTQVVPVLDRLGLDGYFLGVVGLEDTAHHKPSPEPLLRGRELAGADLEDCVYIGDAVVDRRAAAAAGLPAVAVTWGAGGVEDLVAAEPDHLASSVHGLREVLQLDTSRAALEPA